MTDETALATREAPTLTPFEVIERVITAGDLATMAPEDRIAFYWRTCESLGLNPLTRPFEFISLNGRLTMYARKDATDQLRRINGVSVVGIVREKDADLGLITITASVQDPKGRTDEATGVVSIKGLSGEALANALMKAETKAKRRATLSLVGLGFLDESEIEGAGAVEVDPTTGVITERPAPVSLLEKVQAQREALAADAPETTTDGPGGPVASEVTIDTTTAPAAGPGPSDAVEGDFVLEHAADGQAIVTPIENESKGLSQAELFAALEEHRIAREYAAEVSKRLFPGRQAGQPLTDGQRRALLDELLGDL